MAVTALPYDVTLIYSRNSCGIYSDSCAPSGQMNPSIGQHTNRVLACDEEIRGFSESAQRIYPASQYSTFICPNINLHTTSRWTYTCETPTVGPAVIAAILKTLLYCCANARTRCMRDIMAYGRRNCLPSTVHHIS